MITTIEHKNYAVIRNIMVSTGCSIVVGPVACDDRQAEKYRDIDLFGTAEEIASATLELEVLRKTDEDEVD